jgi:hypothetical protein
LLQTTQFQQESVLRVGDPFAVRVSFAKREGGPPISQLSFSNKRVPVLCGSLLANRPEAAEGFVCQRFASGAGLIEIRIDS